MAVEKDQLVTMLQEAKQVTIYYLESVQNSSLEPAAVTEPAVELGKVSTLIHSHVTKIGIVFKPVVLETTYSACSKELTTLLKTLSLLASLLRQFQIDQDKFSKLYVNELTLQFKTLVQCTCALLEELVEVLDLSEENESGQRLVDVGRIWECCDSFKQLGSNGSTGVLNAKITQSNMLIVDALEELEEWLENPHMETEDDPFAVSDLNDEPPIKDNEAKVPLNHDLVEFGKKWAMKMKLVKLLMSTLNKSIPKPAITVTFGTTIDTLNQRRLQLNEYVDELVGSIVWDKDLESAQEAAQDLITCVNSVIQLVSKLNNNDDKKIKWLLTWKAKFLEDLA